MVRHVGDPRLGLAPLGDVDDRDQIAVAAVERDAPSERQHLDLAAVGLQMPPVAAGMVDVADLLQRLAVAGPFVFAARSPAASCRRNVVAAVAVMLDGGVVDAEEFRGLGIEHPHRHRVVVEQQPERGFAPLQQR